MLCAETRGSAAWLILRTLIDLDLAQHSTPGTLDLPITELAIRAGLEPAPTTRALKQLQKAKCITAFIPQHEDENALIKIATPLRTPLNHADVLASHTSHSSHASHLQNHRYCDCPETDNSAPLPAVQTTVDLYFNTCSLKMNAFILDRLTILTAATTPDKLRRTFYRAQKTGIRSLSTIERWCLQDRKQHDRNSGAGVPPAVDGFQP